METKMIELFASVEEHDIWVRKSILAELTTYGITPKLLDDKIEFRYTGSRDVVSRLITLCDSRPAHSIHVSAGS